jgi:alpha-mannosidase
MKSTLTRRAFLQASAAGGAGLLAAWPAWARPLQTIAQATPGVCLTVCNHWSYIGIGWQLGIESCVLSATDAMEMADRPPHVKTCLNLDARAYEFMAEKFPETAERLKKYLAAGKVELIGGTYGQPMGTTIGSESNIRQLVMGREVIRRALGYDMVTFLEEEEFTHPQIPQIAAAAGFKYASLAQLDTWGRAGCPRLDVNALRWRGMDGTDIPCVPKNALFGYAPDLKKLAATADFQKLAALGKPLIFAWEEFGWESPETPAYLTAPDRYRALEQVEFVTLKEYLDKYGAQGTDAVTLPMDAWNKSLTWGLGGDQIRILDRKTEALLLAAEMFDAIAAAHGADSRASLLEKAWRDLLASQSHDVGLCEYSRWQGDRMAPFDRIEDLHNFTWGALGYNHLDAARRQGQAALGGALDFLSRGTGLPAEAPGDRVAIVFNARPWPRTDLVSTGQIHALPPRTREIVIRDRAGRIVPSQYAEIDRDADGNLTMAEAVFPAKDVPAAGYDSYGLEFSGEAAPLPATALRFDEEKLVLENEYVRVRLDPKTGAIAGLEGTAAGGDALDPTNGAFPRFTGRPTKALSTRPDPPDQYDSAASQARIDWTSRGPLWATVRAQHSWPYLKFETRVTLAAGRPYVEAVVRVLAQVPPKTDDNPPDIKEGYWLSFAPGFPVLKILRDFPFGAEETKNPAFHALTWVDLAGPDRGLLVLHAGTQYFRNEADGRVSNLIMREWESHFTGEFGWPSYAEYRYGLWPHAGPLTNGDRLRAAAEFCRPLDCALREPQPGGASASRSFLGIAGRGFELTAFRKKAVGGYELRVAETEGRGAEGGVRIDLPLRGAARTDLVGNRLGDATLENGRLAVSAAAWKILTYRLE